MSAPIKVIAITGGKGGVGKSNVTVNLGVALARQHRRRVVVLDADLGLANIDVLLGLKPKRTLHDVLRGEAGLAEVMVPGPGGIRVVPASSGTREMVSLGPAEHAGLVHAFSSVAHSLDTLLVDTAAGIHDSVLQFVRACQHACVVVSDEPTSITDAYALIKVLASEAGVRRFLVVANMVRTPADGEQVFARLQAVTDRFLDVNVRYAGHIPFDEHVRKAVRRQQAVIEAYPGSPAAQGVRRLAAFLDGLPTPQGPSGQLEFFLDQLVASQPATAAF